MLHTNIVSIESIKTEERLNPRYFRFLEKRNQLLNSSSIPFYQIGEERITRRITDGEHQAINLFYEDEEQAEVRYLYVHNVKEGIIDITDALFISMEDHERLKRSRLEKGNVLLTIVGTIGKSAMVYDYLCELSESNIPRNISKIIVNERNMLPEFLVAFFLSRFGKEQSIYSSGGNIQGLLSLTKLRKMLVPIPDKDTQNEIGNIYIKALELETEALELISQAKQVFYENVDIDFSEFQKQKFFDTNSSELMSSNLWCPIYRYPLYVQIEDAVNSRWPIRKIGILSEVKRGNEVGSANYHNFITKREDDVPFIRTSDIANYEVDLYPDYYVDNEIYDELNQDVKEGDILFSKDGKIGMTAIVTESDESIIASGISRIRPKKKFIQDERLTSEYVFLVLCLKETGYYPAIRRTVIASTIPHLREDRLKEIRIPLLEPHTMKTITNLVKTAFRLKEEKKCLIQKLKNELSSLIGI